MLAFVGVNTRRGARREGCVACASVLLCGYVFFLCLGICTIFFGLLNVSFESSLKMVTCSCDYIVK